MNQPARTITPLAQDYHRIRQRFLQICAPLIADDYNLQAAAFTSPPKWHLAHTSWFFETFLLKPFLPGYRPVDPHYEVLFNSYYNGVGEQFPRPQRGLLSRPGIDAIMQYRQVVDEAMQDLLSRPNSADTPVIQERTRLGIEHEKQHQELFFTDLKYCLAVNPLYPAYTEQVPTTADSAPTAQWQEFSGGLVDIGSDPAVEGFTFDNEGPRHRAYLQPFALARRLVSNGEYQAFIDDGGYRRPELWLADGWTTVQTEGWQAPLYWRDLDGEAMEFTLYGLSPRQSAAPVCHISAYEADAYARWAGARLPREQEWEHGAGDQPVEQHARTTLHPQAAAGGNSLDQLYSDCWQWTGSAYRPYPGFKTPAGAIGEYNGKFMSNQWVLRGGSCASPGDHLRPGYRNFFYPQDRWQFTGLRLARDLD